MLRLSFLVMALLPAALPAQSLRTDLQSLLPQLLCRSGRIVPTTRELWQKQILETQLDAAWIRSAGTSQAIAPEDLEVIAREQAVTKQHRGYSYGICSTHEAWIVSTPAAGAPAEWTQEGIRLNLKTMHERCEKVALHYAEAGQGRPKELRKMRSTDEETLIVHPELLKPGTLGLTCFAADRKQGPELWSLIPIQQVKTDLIPHFTARHRDGTSGLIEWIQEIRKAEGLAILQTGIPALRRMARGLAADPSIRHPHATLMAQKRLLAKKNIDILGENRVKAATNEQMAWLLWYSPTHRQLLLHKSASALGFDVARLQHEKLLVLVLAKI